LLFYANGKTDSWDGGAFLSGDAAQKVTLPVTLNDKRQ
jgi:hypothetical protein